MQTNLAPVCLFVYNRLEETKQTIKALQNNFLAPKSHLYIFSDGSKNENSRSKVQAVRNYIHSIKGFKNVHVFESRTNKGLATSIIDGVTKIINEYDRVIVLEDDLITTPNFLNFINQALEFYEFDKKIQSVNGFSLDLKSTIKYEKDVFFMDRTYSWGWATWKNKWELCEFDEKNIRSSLNTNNIKEFKKYFGEDIFRMLLSSLNGVNDSWYVRWVYSHFINSHFSVYPVESKVFNIGYGTNATHCTTIDVLETRHDSSFKVNFIMDKNIHVNKKLRKEFLNYFTYFYKLIYRIKLLKNSATRKLLYLDIKQKMNKN